MRLAKDGAQEAAKRSKPLAAAMNIFAGEVTNRAVADTFGLPYSPRFET
jgi:alanine dehydrogenase